MDKISRRQLLRGTAAAAATFGAPSVRAQNDQQILRFVAEADLKVLDPVWTTAYITRNHGYLVYDTLFGSDDNLRIRPQMVDQTVISPDGMKYSFTLRDGLRWHDGKPVLSEDCVESLKRWRKKDRLGQLLTAHTGKITPVDSKTFTLQLAEPFGLVLDALTPGSDGPMFRCSRSLESTGCGQPIKRNASSSPARFRGLP
jgi:peptide/nickel transport system substrate-binding protein